MYAAAHFHVGREMKMMWIEKLSTSLGLEQFEQDWGICNSDPTRVAEFMSFFRSNVPDHPWEPEALAELIFQSMNDALELSEVASSLRDDFCSFISSNWQAFPHTIKYWHSLSGNEEFPVTQLIREALPNKEIESD